MLYVFIIFYSQATKDIGVSTNRTIVEMIKLQLYPEIAQMEAFGVVYNDNRWNNVTQSYVTHGTTVPAIICAVKNDYFDIALILSNAATSVFDVNKTDDDGYSALYWAANKGNLQIVESLISPKANINDNNIDFAALRKRHPAISQLFESVMENLPPNKILFLGTGNSGKTTLYFWRWI